MRIIRCRLLCILLVVLSYAPTLSFAFWSAPPQGARVALKAAQEQDQPHVVIVGKIIVDEYGDPTEADAPNVAVGGGGPQAAIGAALALAARKYLTKEIQSSTLPPPQPVTLIGPVGEDFSSFEEESLLEILKPAVQGNPRFLRGKRLVTPRIRLWHDDHQVLQWYALNDSFGNSGAGGLWGSLPTVENYLDTIKAHPIKPILHIISEGGAEAPGGNGDSQPLLDSSLRKAISFLGVEPILFPDDDGNVSQTDAAHCSHLLQRILDATANGNPNSVVLSPDMAAFRGMDRFRPSSLALDSWAVRDGPQGSHIHTQSATPTHVPADTLKEFVNPTGAGNAYSAAFTALRGSGCDAIESACIATGVGAAFCEYSHCPPYSWEVIERVATASQQVKTQVMQMAVKC